VPRFACIVVPRFLVAALLRAEPELRGCPLVLCRPDGAGRAGAQRRTIPGPRSILAGISREAERLGVRVGMTVAQALVRHADLVVRPVDEHAARAAREAVLDVACSISPRVEPERTEVEGGKGFEEAAPDEAHASGSAVCLDVEGLGGLFVGGGAVAAAISARAERLGLDVGVAVADGKATARVAAGLAARRREAILVPPGGDADWLAPLPLAELAPVAAASGGRGTGASWSASYESFQRLGIRRIGDLARLPLREVGSRFGADGARLWRIAAGEDGTPLVPSSPALEFTEGVSLEYSLDSLEGLLFLLRGLLDRLIHRLAIHGLSCGGLRLILDLADRGRAERVVGVLAPTADVKALARLTRSVLESDPPREAIVGVRVVATPDRARPTQLDLFRPSGPSPERLATTLVRLAGLCGAEKVGRPIAPEGYRPEAFGVARFDPPSSSSTARAPECEESEDARGEPQEPLHSARAALRALRPPRRAQVFREGGVIAYVRAPGFGGRAVISGGPWRVETEWWSDRPCCRDYYDVQLSDGGIYRLYCELAPPKSRERTRTEPERWFVDGYYD